MGFFAPLFRAWWAPAQVMGTFGGLLGGVVADFLARRCGLHGRPLSAQFTVAVGIPLTHGTNVAHYPIC